MRKYLMILLVLALLPFGQTSANASLLVYELKSPLTDLDPNGQAIAIRITTFPAKAGIYVQQCIEPVGNARPVTCSETNQLWVTESTSPGQTFWKSPIQINVTASIKSKGVTADCTKVQCGLFFRFDHTAPTDRSEDEFRKITFRAMKPTQQENSPAPIDTKPVPIPVDTNLVPTPVLSDPYFPILKDLKFSIDLAATMDGNSKVTFPAEATIELKVRYHRNATHAIEIGWSMQLDPGVDWKTCSRMNRLRAPSQSFGIQPPDSTFTSSKVVLMEKIGNRKTLQALTRREKVGDWFEDSFALKSPIYDNEFLEPCLGEMRVSDVTLHDVAGKTKIVRYGVDREQYDFVEIYSNNPLLPELTCPRVFIPGWEQNFHTPCVDSLAVKNLSFKITKDLIARGISKPIRLAPPVTDPKKASKESIITCVKGKSSLKVIGVKPKCPAGYKKK